MSEENKDTLKKFVEDKYRSCNRWAKWWSAIYHSSLYISAALGAGAALVLKLEFISNFQYQEDLAAGLAGFAAVVVAVTAAGGFDRKWRVTRASRNMLYNNLFSSSTHI